MKTQPFSISESNEIYRVKSWADKLGVELWHLGDFITRRKDVQEVWLALCIMLKRQMIPNEIHFQSFKTAEIVPKSGKRIIEPMAQELKYMFDQKVSAVRVSGSKNSFNNWICESQLPFYNSESWNLHKFKL